MNKNKKWINPESGKEFDLSHLESFVKIFQVKLHRDAELIDVPVRIFFSNHCYSQTTKEGETAHFEERKKHGKVEQRTFCIDRWEFSMNLPEILKNLSSKTCFVGGNQEILYRLEEPEPRNRNQGWYICMRLNYRNKNRSVELSVRSVHYRTNRPADIRGGTQRFYVLLAKLLKKHQ